MTDHWSFSIVLALLICFAVGAIATFVDVLCRRYGKLGGVIILLVLLYIGIGVCVAVFMAVNPVVPNEEIEYDAREFLR